VSLKTWDGQYYTADKNFVPFRKSDTPESRLPIITVAAPEMGTLPKLGQKWHSPALADAARCAEWAASRPEFALSQITIDSEGKLCLNKAGGARIKLGSGVDLEAKLETLSLLLGERAELRGAGTRVAYVNLLAADAPAVRLHDEKTTSGKPSNPPSDAPTAR
jgi:hypothetical protein